MKGRSGAIAQLGERLDRTQEVAGSSPASSTCEPPQERGFFRSRKVLSASAVAVGGHGRAVAAAIARGPVGVSRTITAHSVATFSAEVEPS
jgi:hypothetical protein